MESNFSKELSAALAAARKVAHHNTAQLTVSVGDRVFAVERMWKTGFAIDMAHAPRLRGRVDVFEGTTHLFQCLIVANHEEAGQMCYDFKRATPVATGAALDFVQEPKADVLRLPRPALT